MQVKLSNPQNTSISAYHKCYHQLKWVWPFDHTINIVYTHKPQGMSVSQTNFMLWSKAMT